MPDTSYLKESKNLFSLIMEYNQLNNSLKRKSLIKRYLSGETNLAEERLLIQWFRQNAAEADEMLESTLLSVLSLPTVGQETALSDDGVLAFDKLVKSNNNPGKLIWKVLAAVASAAAIIAVLFFVPKDVDEQRYIQPSAEELIESIAMLSDISLNEISLMAAEPRGEDFILTVQLTDEAEFSFLVSKNQANGSIRLLANNN